MAVTKFSRATLAAVFLLAACAPLASGPPAATSSPVATSAQSSPEATQEEQSVTLMLWLPSQFDPAGGSQAALLLQSRLGEFSQQHPQLHIITRLKGEEGPGGLLDSLLGAQQAAPLALPDLVLVPASLLPAAVESGAFQPLDGFSDSLTSDDWYPFAKAMVTTNGKAYGLPFVGDALVMAYRSTAVRLAPASWAKLLAARNPLGFAAADPLALFAIEQVFSLQTDPAESALKEENLTSFFEFLADAQPKEIFPFWLTQYQNDVQIWQAFTEGRLPMTVAWTSQLFASQQGEIVGAPLPTQSGDPFTMVKGWAWAITSTNQQRGGLAADLAEFLCAPEFLAQYSAAAGLLPARPTSLAAWAPDARQALASQIILSAVALPAQADLEKWGEALTPAVIAILKQETSPADAVDSVLTSLANSQ